MSHKKATVRLVHAVVSRNYYGSHGGGVIMDVHSRKHSQQQPMSAPGNTLRLMCQVEDCAKQYNFQLFTDEKLQQLSRAARVRRTKRLAVGYVLAATGGMILAHGQGLALLEGASIGLLLSGIVITIVSLLMLAFGHTETYSLEAVDAENEDQSLGVRYVVHGVELS